MITPAQNSAGSPPGPEPLTSPSALVPLSPPDEPTVFVVEDDENIRNILQLLVTSAGIRVETYASAEAFLEHYDLNRPGCLLLDICLSGMDGMELQQRLAAEKIAPPIVFLTGFGDVPTALQAMRTGAIDYIQKPFSAPILISRIREAIAFDCEDRQAHSAFQELERRYSLLTAREQEVLNLLTSGQSTKAIASYLGISPKTVDKHRVKVLEKMRVDNPIELTHLMFSRRSR